MAIVEKNKQTKMQTILYNGPKFTYNIDPNASSENIFKCASALNTFQKHILNDVIKRVTVTLVQE